MLAGSLSTNFIILRPFDHPNFLFFLIVKEDGDNTKLSLFMSVLNVLVSLVALLIPFRAFDKFISSLPVVWSDVIVVSDKGLLLHRICIVFLKNFQSICF